MKGRDSQRVRYLGGDNLAVLVAIDHHGHPNYLAYKMNGDRLRVYDKGQKCSFSSDKFLALGPY